MNVYTIPPSCSFVDALVEGVFEKFGNNALDLAALTILLPSRRACRSLRDAFLRKTNGKPLLLPAIKPMADVEEDAIILTGIPDTTDLPPPVSALRRKIILARYLTKARREEYTPAQALAMAADLGRFLDSVETEGLSLDALDTLVPEEYAAHWQLNLEFLKDVLRVFWPKQLALEGKSDIAAHRRLLVETYAKHIMAHPPAGPIIAAGALGHTKTSLSLLSAIASLPNGYIILPGLDTFLDRDSWQNDLDDTHPQKGLATLIKALGIERDDVKKWQTSGTDTPRDQLISALMRPASAIKSWKHEPLPLEAFDNLSLIETENLDSEAATIALIMRAHAENTASDEPCVLVTPDRILANRVALLLKRWNITVDDSGGIPLKSTSVGQWLVLLADIIDNKQEPVAFLAALKHRFAAGGSNWPDEAGPFRNFVRSMDRFILRGPRPAEGFEGMLYRAEDKADITAGLNHLKQLFEEADTATDTYTRIKNLIALAEKLATTKEKQGSKRLWAGDAGEAMAALLTDLLTDAADFPTDNWQGASALLAASMEGINVRPRYGTHPKLSILGNIEARLYQAGTMILGSLNEGTWPALTSVDGWLSRPMRSKFNLPSPEQGVGIAAHDFAQGLGAAKVILTRSKNRDNAPTTPSRWLQRLTTITQAQPKIPDIVSSTAHWPVLARRLDEPQGRSQPVARPAPNPPIHMRPRKLSVTEISKLRTDPYGIYARHVLSLRPLDDIATEPDAAEKGNLIHDILKDYGTTFPKELPDNALAQLVSIGEKAFAEVHQHPDVTGHWWPRFERMAASLIAHESRWRTDMLSLHSEIGGKLEIPLDQGTFTLEGRADRIEKRKNGWSIIDYKSGRAPSGAKVKSGDEPQLTLLGTMLLAGSFNEPCNQNLTPDSIESLEYWLVGGNSETLDISEIENPQALCAEAHDGLTALMNDYLVKGKPYVCWPDPDNRLRDDYEYAHLARIPEWATSDESDWSDAA